MRFAYTARPQRVVFGAGELANLGAHLNERLPGGGAPFLGGRPALLCTSRTYVRNGTVEQVRAVLGEQVVAVFDGVQPHVPASSLGAALELAVQAGALLVIGLGGGSAIGTAKATAVAVRQRLASHARRVDLSPLPRQST